MGRKAKYSQKIKVKACKEYLSGKKTASQIAIELGMSKYGRRIVLMWINKYRAYGSSIFEESTSNKSYSKEFKEGIIDEYLTGTVSFETLVLKYGIKSNSTIVNWLSKYTKGEEVKDYIPLKEVYSMPRVKTSLEKRLEIVNYCLDNNKDFKNTALKYGVSYSQVYDWVRKYNAKGEDGLNDNRGKRKNEDSLTDQDIKDRKIKELERQNRLLLRQNEVLKKAIALEQEELLLQGIRKERSKK